MVWQFFLEYNNTKIEVDEPVGWDNVSFNLERDLKHYGLTFEFTETLSFVGSGRKFIIDAFNNGNIDALVKIEILYKRSYQDFTNDTTNWQLFYNGILSMKNLTYDRQFAKVRIEPSDFERKFRNSMDIDTEITRNKTVKLHSKVIKKIGTRVIMQDFKDFSFSFLHQMYGPNGDQFKITVNYLLAPKIIELEENKSLNGNLYKTWSANGGYNNGYSNDVSDDDQEHRPIFTFKETGNIKVRTRIKGRVEFRITGANYKMWLKPFFSYTKNNVYFLTQSFNLGGLIFFESAGNQPPNRITYFDFDVTNNSYAEPDVNIFNGFVMDFEQLSPIIYDELIQGTMHFYFDDESFVEIIQDTIKPPTISQGTSLMSAFNEIIQKNTGETNAFRSDFLQKIDNVSLLTNGFSLRQLNEKPFVTNFEKIYNGLRNMFNLGIAITKEQNQNIVRVEPMEYWFKNKETFTIDNPDADSLQITVANDLYFNKIQVGYKDWQNEANGQINGLDEFNSQRQFGLDIRMGQYYDGEKNRKELNIISEIITAGYLIEYQRRLSAEISKDGAHDNSVFFISLNRTNITTTYYNTQNIAENFAIGTVSERNENVGTTNGIISPETAYNLRVAPVRNLVYWLQYIKAQLIKGNANFNFIRYKSTKGNSELETNNFLDAFNGFAVSEKMDIDTLKVYAPFKPIIEAIFYELEYPLSFEQYFSILQNFDKKIKIIMGKTVLYGYIKTLNYNPIKGQGKFKLISKPQIYSLGNGLKISQPNDYVRFYTPTLGHFAKDDDCTISAFLRFVNFADGAGFCPIFGDLDNSIVNGKGYYFAIAPNYLVFGQRSNFAIGDWAQVACYNPILQKNGFYHVSITKKGADASQWQFYINGELQTTIINQNTLTGTAERLGSFFEIGKLEVYYGSMNIFDLMVFNKTLSQEEVLEIYQTKGEEFPQDNSCIFKIPFEEKEGLIIKEVINNIDCDLIGYTLAEVTPGPNNAHIYENETPIQ